MNHSIHCISLAALFLVAPTAEGQIYVNVREYVDDTLHFEREFISLSPEAIANGYRTNYSHDSVRVLGDFGIPLAEAILSLGLRDFLEAMGDRAVEDSIYKYPFEIERVRSCLVDTFRIVFGDTVNFVLVSNVAAEWRFLTQYSREIGHQKYREDQIPYFGPAIYPMKFFYCRRLQSSVLKKMKLTYQRSFPSAVVELNGER